MVVERENQSSPGMCFLIGYSTPKQSALNTYTHMNNLKWTHQAVFIYTSCSKHKREVINLRGSKGGTWRRHLSELSEFGSGSVLSRVLVDMRTFKFKYFFKDLFVCLHLC